MLNIIMNLSRSLQVLFFISSLLFSLAPVALPQGVKPVPRLHSGSISGRVTVSGQPAAGKKVLISEAETGLGSLNIGPGGGTQGIKFFVVLTDADGNYRIDGLAAGKYEVSLELLGSYAPSSIEGLRIWKLRSREVTLE